MSAIAIHPVYENARAEPTVQENQQNPLLKYDAITVQTSNTRWSHVWTIAALASTVAFLALAIGAIIYTTLYAADLALVACFLSAASAPLAFSVFQHFWEKSKNCVSEATFASGVLAHINALTDADVEAFLTEKGIAHSPLKIEEQKRLIARFKHAQDLQVAAKKLALPLTFGNGENRKIWANKEFHEVNVDDYAIDTINMNDPKQAAIFQAIQRSLIKIQMNAIQTEQWKIDQAYILKVLENPNTKGMEAFLVDVRLPILSRLIADHANDLSAFTLIKTPEKSYSLSDLQGMTVIDIAREVFTPSFNDRGIG